MCNIQGLLTNGILRMGEDRDVSEESLTTQWVNLDHFHEPGANCLLVRWSQS
jgi:hypothetical protein